MSQALPHPIAQRWPEMPDENKVLPLRSAVHGRTPKFRKLGVIAGAMKCGTTAAFHALAAHPQIAACSRKEPHFFGRDEQYEMGIDHYESLWTFDPARHAIALDGSTSIARWPMNSQAPARLAYAGYDLKLIYLVRNPIIRTLSNYIHKLARGQLEADIRRDLPGQIVMNSCYATQLRKVTQHIPADRILVLKYEDMVADWPKARSRLLRHLGVQENATLRLEPHNVTGTDFMKPTLEYLMRRSAEPGSKFDPPVWRADGKLDVAATFMPGPIQSEIRDALSADMRALHEEWGIDVATWGF